MVSFNDIVNDSSPPSFPCTVLKHNKGVVTQYTYMTADARAAGIGWSPLLAMSVCVCTDLIVGAGHFEHTTHCTNCVAVYKLHL